MYRNCFDRLLPTSGVTDTTAEIVEPQPDGTVMVRYERNDRVIEVHVDEVAVNDVTLSLYRDGESVGDVLNDHGTAKTMFRAANQSNTDFVSVELPKPFVSRLLRVAEEEEITTTSAEATVAGYRRRVLE